MTDQSSVLDLMPDDLVERGVVALRDGWVQTPADLSPADIDLIAHVAARVLDEFKDVPLPGDLEEAIYELTCHTAPQRHVEVATEVVWVLRAELGGK